MDNWEECGGLKIGPTVLRYLFLHLSKTHPNLLIESKLAGKWAAVYVTATRPSESVDFVRLSSAKKFPAVLSPRRDPTYVHRLLALIPSKGLLGTSCSNEWCYGS